MSSLMILFILNRQLFLGQFAELPHHYRILEIVSFNPSAESSFELSSSCIKAPFFCEGITLALLVAFLIWGNNAT